MTSHGVWKLVKLQSELRKLKERLDVSDMGIGLETASIYPMDAHDIREDLHQRLSDLQTSLISLGTIVDGFQDRLDTDLGNITEFLDDDETQIENIAMKNVQLQESLQKSDATLRSQQTDFLSTINDLRKQAMPDCRPITDISTAIADLRSYIARKK